MNEILKEIIIVNGVEWKYTPDDEDIPFENDPEPSYYYSGDEINMGIGYNDWIKKWEGGVDFHSLNDEYNNPEEAAKGCLDYLEEKIKRYKAALNKHNIEVN